MWCVAAIVALGVAACGDDDDQTPTTAGSGAAALTAEELGAPADAEPVTTPEGDVVYVSESSATIYGACEDIEPHEDDLAGWLEMDPPRGYTDFGVACQ
jgi:hypothetical protein